MKNFLVLLAVVAVLLTLTVGVGSAAVNGRECNNWHNVPDNVGCKNKTIVIYYCYVTCGDCDYAHTCINDHDWLNVWTRSFSDTSCLKLIPGTDKTVYRRGCKN